MYVRIRLAVCVIHLLHAPVDDIVMRLVCQDRGQTENSGRPADLRKYS